MSFETSSRYGFIIGFSACFVYRYNNIVLFIKRLKIIRTLQSVLLKTKTYVFKQTEKTF